MGELSPSEPPFEPPFESPSEPPSEPARFGWRGLAALSGLAAVLVWSSSRYGYHRDELYFLACGRRLAWGYPDQPPLTPLLARAMELLHPHSPLVLRVPAVALMVGVTAVTALLARDFGGGRFAQGLAGLAVGSGTVLLLGGHVLVTATVDLAVWVGITWLAVRLLHSGDRRWWLPLGALLGIGLLNKQLPLLLAAGLVAGLLLTPSARPLLRGPWPWIGGATAAACWAPVLLWQARHGWPQLTLAGQIRAEYGRPGERIAALVGQLLLFGLGAGVLWIMGVRQLFRRPELAPYRPLAWAWVVAFLLFVVTAGQVYYLAGLYPVLIAAGAVAVERWRRRRAVAMVALVVVTAALLVPSVLPVLSPSELDASPWAALSEPQLDMVGWPALVDQVAAAYRTIPAPDRARAVVFTNNYGEAGAVEEYGPARGVPVPAYSGHNGFAGWGPPPVADGPVVVVREGDPAGSAPSRWFTGCRSAGPVVTGVRNEESRFAQVWTCTGTVGGWTAIWPQLTFLAA